MLDFKDVKYEEIPEIDLYMDQVTNYLEKQLDLFKKDDKDKILTKTMINNYVKAGIIEKPLKKKYTQDHMAKMIMVYFFKNIVSMNEIAQIFNSELAVDELYEKFNKIHNQVLDEAKDMMKKIDDQSDKLELAMTLLLQADINKRLAESIVKEM